MGFRKYIITTFPVWYLTVFMKKMKSKMDNPDYVNNFLQKSEQHIKISTTLHPEIE